MHTLKRANIRALSSDMAFDTMSDVSYLRHHDGPARLRRWHGFRLGAYDSAYLSGSALEFVKTRPGISIVVKRILHVPCTPGAWCTESCAINPEPTAEQLADIAVSSAETARAFGIEPRIAMLSYSTGESGKGPEVDKVADGNSNRTRTPS